MTIPRLNKNNRGIVLWHWRYTNGSEEEGLNIKRAFKIYCVGYKAKGIFDWVKKKPSYTPISIDTNWKYFYFKEKTMRDEAHFFGVFADFILEDYPKISLEIQELDMLREDRFAW